MGGMIDMVKESTICSTVVAMMGLLGVSTDYGDILVLS
jgi:hypothetical protein